MISLSAVVTADHLARAWVVTHRFPPADGLMWLLSNITEGGKLWLVLSAIVSIRRGRPGPFITVALTLLLSAILTEDVLKPTVGRERPFVVTPNVLVIGGRPYDSSFPSGHASSSVAAALILGLSVPTLRFLWWTLAVAVAYSRVYLGVHYPLDVLGGGLVGASCAAVVLAASSRWRMFKPT
jgi:undecaprenyl-diphosphatase